MGEDLKMGKSWKHDEALGGGTVWGAQLGGEFRKGLKATMVAGTSPGSRTGGGRALSWYSTGAAVLLVFITPFFHSLLLPTPADIPLRLPTSPLSPNAAERPLSVQSLGNSTVG